MASPNPSKALNKLSEILKIANIDIECVGCKEVYPDFMTQLISRISTSVSEFYKPISSDKKITPSEPITELGQGYQDRNGQLIGVSWSNFRKMNLFTSSKQPRGKFSDPVHDFGLISERKCNRDTEREGRIKTPQTERFRYSMAKTNEIDLAVEKKSQMVSACKEEQKVLEESGKNVRLNELSFGGKYVYGRSGSKWDRGENFKDLAELNLFENYESKKYMLIN